MWNWLNRACAATNIDQPTDLRLLPGPAVSTLSTLIAAVLWQRILVWMPLKLTVGRFRLEVVPVGPRLNTHRARCAAGLAGKCWACTQSMLRMRAKSSWCVWRCFRFTAVLLDAPGKNHGEPNTATRTAVINPSQNADPELAAGGC